MAVPSSRSKWPCSRLSITSAPLCDDKPRADSPRADWQHLRPHAVKLLNSVSADSMAATASRFVELGFPWQEDDVMDALAKLFVSASAAHGFYAECYGQLACALNDQEIILCRLGTSVRFLSAVRAALSSEFSTVLSDMSAPGNSSDTYYASHALQQPWGQKVMPTAEGKARDRLVHICKLAASLFHLRAYAVEDLHRMLQCLGVLNTVTVRQAAVAVASATPEQQVMPTVSMLSGNFPSAQPTSGETMADWRERLASEIKFPPDRLGLLAGDAEVPADACLDDFQGSLQVIVRHVHIKEEYRIEAGCTLLSKASSDLITSADGRELLKVVVDHWEELGQEIPKRARFMIMDLKSAIAGCSPRV